MGVLASIKVEGAVTPMTPVVGEYGAKIYFAKTNLDNGPDAACKATGNSAPKSERRRERKSETRRERERKRERERERERESFADSADSTAATSEIYIVHVTFIGTWLDLICNPSG